MGAAGNIPKAPPVPSAIVRRMGYGPVPFTVTDALSMVEQGIIPEDATVELLNGALTYRDRFDLRGSSANWFVGDGGKRRDATTDGLRVGFWRSPMDWTGSRGRMRRVAAAWTVERCGTGCIATMPKDRKARRCAAQQASAGLDEGANGRTEGVVLAGRIRHARAVRRR